MTVSRNVCKNIKRPIYYVISLTAAGAIVGQCWLVLTMCLFGVVVGWVLTVCWPCVDHRSMLGGGVVF